MARNIGNLIKDVIRQQGLEVSDASNLYGTPLVLQPFTPSTQTTGEWIMHYLDTMTLYGPDEIISKAASVQLQSAPIIHSAGGILYNTTDNGSTMFSTTVNIPSSITMPISITCTGKQVRLFVGQTLVRGANNGLSTTISLPTGKTSIHVIITGGGSTPASIVIPADVPIMLGNVLPPIPLWVGSGAINSQYVDPATGSTGIRLNWFNQDNVGGWGVYAVTTNTYGNACSITPAGNRTIISTNFSGTAPYDSAVIQINGVPIGIVDKAYYDDQNVGMVIITLAFGDITNPSTIASGIVSALSFTQIAAINRTSTDSIISFIDPTVKAGNTYSYCIDSFSPNDPTIRSSKSFILSTVAGDVTPPGPVQIQSISLQGTSLTVYYHTPSDPDYYATKAFFYQAGSGTGPIVNTQLLTDAGYPNTNDSLVFDIANLPSGTVYLLTADILGNTQNIVSGVPFFYTTGGFVAWHGPLVFSIGGSSGLVLSGTLDMNGFQIIDIGSNLSSFSALGQLTIPIATGTSPMIISSTTKVTNLNVDLLDGLDSTAFGILTSNQTWTGTNVFTNTVNFTGNNVFSGTVTFTQALDLPTLTGGLKITGSLGAWGSGWVKDIEIDIGGVLKWTGANTGFRHAIGANAGGGLFFLRSTADDNSVVTMTAGTIADTGQIGLNTNSPKGIVHVITSGNAGIPGYAIWQSDPSVAYGGGVLLTNNPNNSTGAETSLKFTSTFNNTYGRARLGWVLNSDPETFIDSGSIMEFGSHQTIGFAGTPFNTSSLLKFTGVLDNLNGQTQRAFDFDAQSNSLATTASEVIAIRGGTQAAAYTTAQVNALHIFDAILGAGSTITTQVGLRIDNQTKGGTNRAIQTGLGPVAFGDTLLMGNNIIQAIGAAGTNFLAGGGLTLAQDLTVNVLGAFDSTATPTKDYLLSYNSAAAKWQPRLVQIGFNNGQVTSAPTSSGFSGDNSQSAIVNTVVSPTGTPGTMSGTAPVLTPIYNGMIIDLSTSYPAGLQPGFIFIVDYSINSGTTFTNGAMKSTATKIVHAGLNQAWGYEYRYVVSGSASTGNSPTSAITKPSAQSETNAFGLIVASQIATINLSSISANIGDISAGQLRNSINTAGVLFSNTIPSTWTQGIFFANANPPPGTVTGMYIDFSATGSNNILFHPGLALKANGSAVFSGTITANTITVGSVVSVTGNFSNSLSVGMQEDIGSLNLQTNFGGANLLLKSSRTAHGLTGIVPANVYSAIGEIADLWLPVGTPGSLGGGLNILAIGSGTVPISYTAIGTTSSSFHRFETFIASGSFAAIPLVSPNTILFDVMLGGVSTLGGGSSIFRLAADSNLSLIKNGNTFGQLSTAPGSAGMHVAGVPPVGLGGLLNLGVGSPVVLNGMTNILTLVSGATLPNGASGAGFNPYTISWGDISIQMGLSVVGRTVFSGTSLFSGVTTIVNNLLLESDIYVNSGTVHTKTIASPNNTVVFSNATIDLSSGGGMKLPAGSTGTGAPSLGATAPPAIGTLASVNTWIPFTKSNGTTVWIPAWA